MLPRNTPRSKAEDFDFHVFESKETATCNARGHDDKLQALTD